MSIKTGYFRMTAVHPTDKTNLRFEALYDETVPNVVAGYATWETVARPHRRSLTNWTGSEPLKLQIGFILDGFASHDAVDEDCRTLEIMAGLVADGIEPPLIKLDSDGFIPHDVVHASQNQWVLMEIIWGDAIRDGDGTRYRQQGTITLMEYVQDDVVQSLSAAGRARSGTNNPSIRRKRYTVKKGDTLRKIAAHLLHNAHRWHEIAKLNHLRDPRHLKVGQKLKIPK